MQFITGLSRPDFTKASESQIESIPVKHLTEIFSLVSDASQKHLSHRDVHRLKRVFNDNHQELLVYLMDSTDFSILATGDLTLNGLWVMNRKNPDEKAKMPDLSGDLIFISDKSNVGLFDLYYIPTGSKKVTHYLINHKGVERPLLTEYHCQKD